MITLDQIEQSTLQLIYEWLSKWFDGGSHTVSGFGLLDFPQATILFGEAAPPQPLNGVMIQVIHYPGRNGRYRRGGGTQITQAARLDFHVQAAMSPGTSGTTARSLCLKTSDRLFLILNRPLERADLVNGGMILSSRMGAIITGKKYVTRLVATRAQLECASPD